MHLQRSWSRDGPTRLDSMGGSKKTRVGEVMLEHAHNKDTRAVVKNEGRYPPNGRTDGDEGAREGRKWVGTNRSKILTIYATMHPELGPPEPSSSIVVTSTSSMLLSTAAKPKTVKMESICE